MSEYVISREKGVFLFQNKAHVVHCVAGGQHGADRGTLGEKDLSVFDGKLAWTGLVFVYPRSKLGIIGDEIRDSACVITMPVSKKDMRYFEVVVFKKLDDICGPDRDALIQS